MLSKEDGISFLFGLESNVTLIAFQEQLLRSSIVRLAEVRAFEAFSYGILQNSSSQSNGEQTMGGDITR